MQMPLSAVVITATGVACVADSRLERACLRGGGVLLLVWAVEFAMVHCGVQKMQLVGVSPKRGGLKMDSMQRGGVSNSTCLNISVAAYSGWPGYR